LDKQSESLNGVQLPEVAGAGETGVAASKKDFVEPEVSFPVDVLEATTFFQATESGSTNP
jgi:hypothetical protein